MPSRRKPAHQRLRTYIRKGINEDDILKAVGIVATEGVKQLKLYFMVGLPTETDEDIEEMARLVKQCKEVMDTGTDRRADYADNRTFCAQSRHDFSRGKAWRRWM